MWQWSNRRLNEICLLPRFEYERKIFQFSSSRVFNNNRKVFLKMRHRFVDIQPKKKVERILLKRNECMNFCYDCVLCEYMGYYSIVYNKHFEQQSGKWTKIIIIYSAYMCQVIAHQWICKMTIMDDLIALCN